MGTGVILPAVKWEGCEADHSPPSSARVKNSCSYSSSLVEVDIATGKSKKYKSPSSDQIPPELIKTGGEILYSEIHKLICSIWNKEELP
jgi:hypothetical protein